MFDETNKMMAKAVVLGLAISSFFSQSDKSIWELPGYLHKALSLTGLVDEGQKSLGALNTKANIPGMEPLA